MKQQMNIEEINAFICKMADKDVVGINIASSVQDCLRKIGFAVDEGELKDIRKPRFCIGDVLRRKGKGDTFIVDRIIDGFYISDHKNGAILPIEKENDWEYFGNTPVHSNSSNTGKL